MDDFDLELRAGFLDEAMEMLEVSERALLNISDFSKSGEVFTALARTAHNLKGSGSAVGFQKFGETVHKIENVIVALRDGIIPANTETIARLVPIVDFLKKYVQVLKNDFNAHYDTSDLETRLAEVLSGPAEAPAAVAAPAAATAPKPEVSLVQEAVAPPPVQSGPVLEVQAPAPASPLVAEASHPTHASNASKGNFESLRVSLNKLDNALNLIGELVVYQNILNEARKRLVDEEFDHLQSTISRINALVREIQQASFALRMLPIGGVFTKMKRIVFDVSRQLNKVVEFETSGEHIELDKSVVDGMADPLTHFVRNALDHGVETPEERIAAGKERTAHVRLSARKEASCVVIELSDDGKGLRKDKIIQKAIEKKLIKPDAKLTDQEIHQLIFLNGFSTKDQVSEISGRGVGMDVARENVQALNGEIEIESTEGKGSTFRIILPQSIAIIDGMVCELENDRYIIPLNQLSETLQIPENQVDIVNQRSHCVRIRKEELPLYNLSDVLLDRPTASFRGGPLYGVICTIAGKKLVFAVSRLLGVQQLVVKPLGPEFQNLPGLAGGAVLGDGSPGLILDLHSLANQKILKGKAA